MKGKVLKNHLRNWMEEWNGDWSLSVRCIFLVATVVVVFSILSVNEVEAKSKKKYRLSYTSKTMEQGELYNISMNKPLANPNINYRK